MEWCGYGDLFSLIHTVSDALLCICMNAFRVVAETSEACRCYNSNPVPRSCFPRLSYHNFLRPVPLGLPKMNDNLNLCL